MRTIAFVTTAILLVASAAATGVVAGTLGGYRHLMLDGHGLKWGAPEIGAGAVVTYATVGTSRTFPAARNCRELVPLDGLLKVNQIPRATFDSELKAAFDTWSAIANVRFEPASADTAQILIGAEGAPNGRAFTSVQYDTTGKGALAPLIHSVICLNPKTGWKAGFDGNLDVYDLRYTLAHEIGHAIGLNHPGARDQLMSFRYSEAFRGPQIGDISGAVALYGPNLMAGAAVPPVAPDAGPTGTSGPSLGLGAD